MFAASSQSLSADAAWNAGPLGTPIWAPIPWKSVFDLLCRSLPPGPKTLCLKAQSGHFWPPQRSSKTQGQQRTVSTPFQRVWDVLKHVFEFGRHHWQLLINMASSQNCPNKVVVCGATMPVPLCKCAIAQAWIFTEEPRLPAAMSDAIYSATTSVVAGKRYTYGQRTKSETAELRSQRCGVYCRPNWPPRATAPSLRA